MAKRYSTTKGFARTASLLQPQIRKAGETRGFAVTRLLTHWPDIVGPDMAAMARPVDVKYGRQGFGATLTVLTTGAQAPLLEMQKEKLREKVNGVYGFNAIARIRITQTAASGFAEGQASFTYANAPAARPAPSAEIQQEARTVAQDIGDASLRNALETLAQNVLTKTHR